MPVLPSGTNDRIEWFENRLPAWTGKAAEIGLQADQVAQLQTLTDTARAAYAAAQAARIASKNATLALRTAERKLVTYGSDLIQAVKIFAQTTDNPEVYTIASVPPPSPPTPAGAPTPPTDLSADPNADGTVTLRWKGSVANHTFFTVWRKPAGAAAFTQIGSVAAKAFVDASVPAGVPSVAYVVRAQRGMQVSANSDETVVNFGAGDGSAAQAA